ncbi:MAG: protein kinase, partial [Planctomycetales bacterium]|nr:protein kinase [Planctomycetales bacterium]
MSAFLADFGLAKLAATGSRLTRTGQALGTPAYMSPEQARGEVSSLTPASDVWSLGCVLYEMLAGCGPFDAPTSAAVVGLVLTQHPPRLRRQRPDIPRDLEATVRAALSKAAGKRHRTAGEFRDDLARLLAGERPARRSRSRVRGGMAAGAGAALLAALLLARSSPEASSPDDPPDAPVPHRPPP